MQLGCLAVVLLVVAIAGLVRAAHADAQLRSEGRLQRAARQRSAEGPADAPITIVAWSDYACGYCNRVQPTLDRLDQLYPGPDPLGPSHAAARRGLHARRRGSARRCRAGQVRPMHGRLFALHGRVTRAEAELVARELGLDMIRFRGDLDAGTYRAAIAADMAMPRSSASPDADVLHQRPPGDTAASRSRSSSTPSRTSSRARRRCARPSRRPLRGARRERQADRRSRPRRSRAVRARSRRPRIASVSASGPPARPRRCARHDRRVERLPVPVLHEAGAGARARARRSTAIKCASSIATCR